MGIGPARRRGAAPLLVLCASLSAAACSSVAYTQDYDRLAPAIQATTWRWRPLSPAQQQAFDRISPFLNRRIERAVQQELSDRGFELVDGGDATYLVSAYPILPDRTSRAAYRGRARPPVRVAVGFGVGWGRPYGGWGPYPYGRWSYGYAPAYGYWGPYMWPMGWTWPYYGYPAYGWVPGFGFAVSSAGGYGRPVVGSGDRGPGSLVIEVLDARSRSVVWQGVAQGALLDMPPVDEMDAYVDGVVARTLKGFPPGNAD